PDAAADQPQRLRRAAGRHVRQLQRHHPRPAGGGDGDHGRRYTAGTAAAAAARRAAAGTRAGDQPRRRPPADGVAGAGRGGGAGGHLDGAGRAGAVLRAAGGKPRLSHHAGLPAPARAARGGATGSHCAGRGAGGAGACVRLRHRARHHHRVRGRRRLSVHPAEGPRPMIQTQNVSKSYGADLVVDDVTLQLPARGVTSIIGPNGAGKSTLLGMVSRLLPMSAGTVTVDGLDVTTTPTAELARRLAILRQDNQIAARLTVQELVAFGRYPHSEGRTTAADREHVERAIDFLNLGALQHRFLDELSGGQRQRAFVAMVLCQDTDYVLLDEPLNNLD